MFDVSVSVLQKVTGIKGNGCRNIRQKKQSEKLERRWETSL